MTSWTVACQASLSFTISQTLLRFMSTELVMLSNHLFLWHLLLILSSVFLSIRVFSNELTLHISWPKYWSFSFSISPSSEYSGFIYFMIDWVDLLESKGLWSLLQHHSSKASILLHSPFFMVQLSHPNTATGETMALKYKGYFICLYLTVHDSLKHACRSGLIQALLKIEYILSGPRLGVNFLSEWECDIFLENPRLTRANCKPLLFLQADG